MRKLPSAEALNLNLIYDPFDGSLHWRISGEPFGKIYADGYVSGYFDGLTYGAHRLIYKMMTGQEPQLVDHGNGCRSDNRWKNLADATPLINSRNLGVSRRNKSGCTGVKRTKYGTFRADICVDKTRYWLGSFKTLAEAVAVRKAAEKQHGFNPNHGRIDL